jgi:hypothetical protein
MNYGRLVGAAAAATVVDAIYGYLVYGVLLASEFGRYPDIYRPPEFAATYLPPMFLGIFAAMLAAVAIYAKGYEGGSGIAEGVRFGALLAFFVAVLFASVNYGTLNIGRKLTLGYLVAGFFEWLIVGIVIGLVYKPSSVPGQCRPAAGV